MKGYIFILAVTIALTTGVDCALQCISCSGIEDGGDCDHVETCSGDEVCYMHSYLTESKSALFDYGCATLQSCPINQGPIVGRRSEGHHVRCTKCCSDADICNGYLNCSVPTTTPTTVSRECSEIKLHSPHAASGVYTIYPTGTVRLAVSVYCLVDVNGTAWTVIQRRHNGTVDFYRDWNDYKHGFGSPYGEYWIGNDILHELTSHSNHEIKVEMSKFDGTHRFVQYTTFHVGDEMSGYPAHVIGFTGNGSNCWTTHSQPISGMKFSTYDVDNDISPDSCAQHFKGGWWYRNCHCSNLNGLYLAGHHDSYADGVNWNDAHYSLKDVTMMIRPLRN